MKKRIKVLLIVLLVVIVLLGGAYLVLSLTGQSVSYGGRLL